MLTRISQIPIALGRRLRNYGNRLRRRRFRRPSLVALQGFPPVFASGIEVAAGARRLWIKADSSLDLLTVTKEVFVENRYCPPDLPVRIGAQDIVFDVGANVGVFAIYAALHTTSEIFAFEPVPANYGLLVKNIETNRLGNVRAIASAVSDRSKMAEMLLFDGEMTGCRIPSPVLDQPRAGTAKLIRVTCTTIAEAMRNASIHRIDFLKMDCEGEEFAILYGMDHALLRNIGTIALEYHDNVGKGHSTNLAEHLAAQGFEVCLREDEARSTLGYLYAWQEKRCEK